MLSRTRAWSSRPTLPCNLKNHYPSFNHAIPQSQHRQASSATSGPARKVIFSGIQPTGIPHLGNYLGALQKWVQLQNDAEADTTLIYSLVDLHALTIHQDPAQLRQWRKEALAILLAIGLNPARSMIFFQGDVPAHSELMWILSCQASTGYLSRMIQWKSKTEGEKTNNPRLKLGLFSYPVLQAADVLVHRTTHVPVGEDQAQHLEFARELAKGFNSVFGKDILTPPETIISVAKRILSLTEHRTKMSKSAPDPKSRILLTDTADEIKAKFRSARTDSLPGIQYDPRQRPEVSNLIDIIYYGSPGANEDRNDIEKQALAAELGQTSLKVLKEKAFEVTEALVGPIRERFKEIISNETLLDDVAAQGAEKARDSAAGVLKDVKQAVGLA